MVAFGEWSFGEWSPSEIGRSEIGRSEIGRSEIGRSENGRCTWNLFLVLPRETATFLFNEGRQGALKKNRNQG
jgi:hypothetical protein